MAEPSVTVLATGQRGTAATISFTAQPTTSLLILHIADGGEQFSRNAPAVTGYTNQIDGDHNFVYTKVSAGETTIDLPADPNSGDATIYVYSLIALTDIDTANPIAFIRTEQVNGVITGFTNEAVAGERYWIGFYSSEKSFGACTYTVNNSYVELVENSQAYGGGATVLGGIAKKYVAAAAASETQNVTFTPGASQGNRGAAGLILRVANLNKSGTGSIDASAVTVASSSGTKAASGTGSISSPATVPDAPGAKAAFGTAIVPELAVLTSEGEGDNTPGGTGTITVSADLTSAPGFKTVEGTGVIPVTADPTAVGSKDISGGSDPIVESAVLTASGTKSVGGTGSIPVSTVTFSSDEFKEGYGQGVLTITEPVLTGEGEELLIRFGTATLPLEAVLTAVGKKAVSGTVVLPVASVLTSQGFDGPIETGIRRWNGFSEDIVKLFVLEEGGVERPALIEWYEG